MSTREPTVAGMFYEADSKGLKKQVESCFLHKNGPETLPSVNPQGPRSIVGLVSPHAGLIYSGSVAAWAYYRLAEDGLPDTAVLIGPNHRSYFPAAAVSDAESWRTPMGTIYVDLDAAQEIASGWEAARMDQSAHRLEHSLEVQIPFIQYLSEIGQKDIRIVPILLGAAEPGTEMNIVRNLGDSIAKALSGRNAVVIASTDFTHYESGASAQLKDSQAMSAILSLDEEALLDTVSRFGISMCGYLPTAVTIAACKGLGASSARELAYHNSGEVTGDYSEVVGYGTLEIDK